MDATPDEVVTLIADSARLMQAEAEAEAADRPNGSTNNASWRRQQYAQIFAIQAPEGRAAAPLPRFHRARSLPASVSASAASFSRPARAASIDTGAGADEHLDTDLDMPAPPLAALRAAQVASAGGRGGGHGLPSLNIQRSSVSFLGEPAPGAHAPNNSCTSLAALHLADASYPLVIPLGQHVSR